MVAQQPSSERRSFYKIPLKLCIHDVIRNFGLTNRPLFDGSYTFPMALPESDVGIWVGPESQTMHSTQNCKLSL